MSTLEIVLTIFVFISFFSLIHIIKKKNKELQDDLNQLAFELGDHEIKTKEKRKEIKSELELIKDELINVRDIKLRKPIERV